MTSRRDFLKQSAVGGMGGWTALAGLTGTPMTSTTNSADAAESHDVPIVDTHQHLWDLEKFNLPWLERVPQLRRSYVMSDYLKATEGLGVVKTVYMEVDVHPSQQVKEAEYVIDLCRRDDNPMAAAVISGRPAHDDFAPYIKRFAESPYIKGVRQVLHPPSVPAGYCLQPEFIRSVRLLGELGLSYDLVMRNSELEDGAKLVAACPDTRFILDHCGNGDVQSKDRSQWKQGLAAVARQRNVVCKISGIVASAKPGAWGPEDLAPIINYTIDQFGIDRVMFAGDWPVCTLAASFRQWVEALREIISPRSLAERRKLFHDNAVEFYGLG